MARNIESDLASNGVPIELRAESFETEYESIAAIRKDPTNPLSKQAAAKVHELLNRVFYPFVFDLHQKVEAMSREELEHVVKMDSEQSPQIGEYKKFGQTDWISLNLGGKGEQYDFMTVLANANGGNANFYDLPALPKRAKEFAFIPLSKEKSGFGAVHDGQLSLCISPVGDYGPQLAREMAVTTKVLSELTKTFSRRLSAESASKNPLLLNETGRFRLAPKEKVNQSLSPLSTMIEGIVTLNQVLSILVSQKIAGLETGAQAMEAIVLKGKSSGITTEFTRRVPLGVTGPMNLRGDFIDNPVVPSESGTFSLSEHLKKVIRGYYNKKHESSPESGVCPMASVFLGKRTISGKNDSDGIEYSRSGIQLLAETYLKVYEVVHQSLK